MDVIKATANVVLAIAPCDSRRANEKVRTCQEAGHAVDKKRANQLLSEAVRRELLARVYYGEYCYYVHPAKALDIIGAPGGEAPAARAVPATLTQVRFSCNSVDCEAIRAGTVSMREKGYIDGTSACVAVIDAALLRTVDDHNSFEINGCACSLE